MQEIIVYRSPPEKLAAEWLMAHPGYALAAYAVVGFFGLVVFTGIVATAWKVFKAQREFDRDFFSRHW